VALLLQEAAAEEADGIYTAQAHLMVVALERLGQQIQAVAVAAGPMVLVDTQEALELLS
jgi:hypothetical protein